MKRVGEANLNSHGSDQLLEKARAKHLGVERGFNSSIEFD